MNKKADALPKTAEYYEEYLSKICDKKYRDQFSDVVTPNAIFKLFDVQSGASYYSRMIDYLEIVPYSKLLDVGCSFGALLQIAANRGTLTWGVDVARNAVEVAKCSLNTSKIILANAEYLPFEDSFFDYITCIGTLEHVSNINAAIKEIARTIKVSGKTLIVVPNIPIYEKIKNVFRKAEAELKATDQLNEQVFFLPEWKKRLEENGLKVLKVYKDNHTWLKKKNSLDDWLRILRRAIRKILPIYFSYQFIFICIKK